MANQTSTPAGIKELAKCIEDIYIGIMGDPEVGKSRLYQRFVGGHTNADKCKHATIYVDSELRITDYCQNVLNLRIWDSPTFDDCQTFIIPCPSRDSGNTAHGIILMYDCTNQESFDNLNNWLDVIDYNSPYTVPKLLVGNKSDLLDKKVVDYATAKKYADGRGIPLVETSAARDTNVHLALKMLITNLCQRQAEKMQRIKKQEQQEWQQMIEDSRKSQEKMQREKQQQQMIQLATKLREKEQQKMIQLETKLREREQLKKEQQLKRQLKRKRIEDERRARKWQEIIQQRRKQQAKERQRKIQQRKDQQKREHQKREHQKRKQQRREQSEKDQQYMMQLLIPLVEKLAKNTTSPEHLSATVAAEMRTDVGLPVKKEREIQNIREVEKLEEEESIADQEIREYEEAMSLFNKHSPFEKNAVHERLFFRNMQQKGRETIAQYANRLKERAQSCEFGTTIDEHVRDQMVGSCRSTEMFERFLDEGAKLTLERLLEIGTLFENTDE